MSRWNRLVKGMVAATTLSVAGFVAIPAASASTGAINAFSPELTAEIAERSEEEAEFAEEVYMLVNEERRDHGLDPITRIPALDIVAHNWSEQMAADKRMYHNPNWLDQYPGLWLSASEIIATTTSSPEDMIESWMNSPVHKQAILGTTFSGVGIGVAFDDTGKAYGTQNFVVYPPSDESLPATPTPVQHFDNPGGDDDHFIIPTDTTTLYLLDNKVLEPGRHNVTKPGTYTITGIPAPGYYFEGNKDSYEWTSSYKESRPSIPEQNTPAPSPEPKPTPPTEPTPEPSTGSDLKPITKPSTPTPPSNIPGDNGSATGKIDDGGVGGKGNQYFLNDAFSPYANIVFKYGNRDGRIYVGDWDGDGKDSLAYRIGNTFYIRNSNSSGGAHQVFNYGRANDRVYVGDWNGDGKDTFAVRRGKTYHVKNSLSGGDADHVIHYGRQGDDILVGDWDGDGKDTFAVRRGSVYHVKNSIAGGNADKVVNYGRKNDDVYVGNWNGKGGDSFAVRRGNTYYIANAIRGGDADRVLNYGRTNDTTLVGDWNGDGKDTLGVRRP